MDTLYKISDFRHKNQKINDGFAYGTQFVASSDDEAKKYVFERFFRDCRDVISKFPELWETVKTLQNYHKVLLKFDESQNKFTKVL